MTKEDEGRFMGLLRATLNTLRADLWTTAYDPLPRLGRPRLLVWLPHVLIVLFAAVLLVSASNQFENDYGLGQFGKLLALTQVVALVVAMFRPLLAWWVVTIVMLVGAQAGEAHAAGSPLPPWINGGPDGGFPFHGGSPFPWTPAGILVQAGVMFLLALRVSPRVVAETLAIAVLAGMTCRALAPNGHQSNAPLAVLAFVIAAALGAALRSRRVARTQLVVQEELTAEERARRTLLEERNRIARELHDVVAHHMSVISIQAQVAPHLVENPSEELKENLRGIRENAVEALAELRTVLGVLRSEDALSEGMRHAPQPTLDRLDELVANVRGAGLKVTVETTGDPHPLLPGIELSAFRIVQEALSNAMRHAPGAEVRVELGYHPSGITVRVANTAPDRAAPPSPGAGHGLLGMRERTAMLGGELATGATPDGGFEVTAMLPTKAPAAAAPPTESAHPAEPSEDTP